MGTQEFMQLPAARVKTFDVVIANGGNTSAAVDLEGYRIAGIRMPASWTAAAIAFSESPDDASYLPVYDDGGGVAAAEIRIPVTSSVSHRLADQLLLPYRFIKLRSVAAADGAAVNQTGGDKTITLLCRPAT